MSLLRRWLRRWLAGLLGYPDCGYCRDLDDEVPGDIGVTRLGGYWYITATYGTGDDHQHQEIKLDEDRYQQLREDVVRIVAGHSADCPGCKGKPGFH